MKKLFLPLSIIAVLVALYEQSKPNPNIYVMVIAIVIFMIGVMRLSAKLPSKNQNTEQDDADNRR